MYTIWIYFTFITSTTFISRPFLSFDISYLISPNTPKQIITRKSKWMMVYTYPTASKNQHARIALRHALHSSRLQSRPFVLPYRWVVNYHNNTFHTFKSIMYSNSITYYQMIILMHIIHSTFINLDQMVTSNHAYQSQQSISFTIISINHDHHYHL